MNCEEILILMNEKLDGCISPEDDKVLTAHLNKSASSRALFEKMQQADEELKQSRLEPPAQLHDGVMEEIRQQKNGRTGRKTWYAVAAIATVAAVLAVLSGIGLVKMPGMQGGKVNSLSMSEAVRAAASSDVYDVSVTPDAFAIAEENGCAVTVFRKCSGLKELADAEHETTEDGAQVYTVSPQMQEKLQKKYAKRYDSVTVLPKQVSREDLAIVMLVK